MQVLFIYFIDEEEIVLVVGSRDARAQEKLIFWLFKLLKDILPAISLDRRACNFPTGTAGSVMIRAAVFALYAANVVATVDRAEMVKEINGRTDLWEASMKTRFQVSMGQKFVAFCVCVLKKHAVDLWI